MYRSPNLLKGNGGRERAPYFKPAERHKSEKRSLRAKGVGLERFELVEGVIGKLEPGIDR